MKAACRSSCRRKSLRARKRKVRGRVIWMLLSQTGTGTWIARTLTRQYYSAEQDFDLLWLGAWKDGNAIGQGRDQYHATGGAVRAGFSAVVDCNVKEGATYDSIATGLKAWGNVIGENGSEAAIYQWCPVYGGGDADFDFKIVSVYQNYAEQGADLERLGNGESWRKRNELVWDQFDCDVSRVYDGKVRRAAQLR